MKKRKVTKVKVGDVIDVRDTEYIWCKGDIRKIIKGEKSSMFSGRKS
jgi:hypothetical protein